MPSSPLSSVGNSNALRRADNVNAGQGLPANLSEAWRTTSGNCCTRA